MVQIEFTKEFLARLLMTEPERLNFCLISRIYHNPDYGTFRVPGLRIEGISDFRFSLFDGEFVSIGELMYDSRIEAEDATLEPSARGWLFRTPSGGELDCSEEQLIHFARRRVVNEALTA